MTCTTHIAFHITIYALHCTNSQCTLHFSEISRNFTSIIIVAVVWWRTHAKRFACKGDFLLAAVSDLHVPYPCRNKFTVQDSCLKNEDHYVCLYNTLLCCVFCVLFPISCKTYIRRMHCKMMYVYMKASQYIWRLLLVFLFCLLHFTYVSSDPWFIRDKETFSVIIFMPHCADIIMSCTTAFPFHTYCNNWISPKLVCTP